MSTQPRDQDLGGTFGLAALDTLRQIAESDDATADELRQQARQFIETRAPRVDG